MFSLYCVSIGTLSQNYLLLSGRTQSAMVTTDAETNKAYLFHHPRCPSNSRDKNYVFYGPFLLHGYWSLCASKVLLNPTFECFKSAVRANFRPIRSRRVLLRPRFVSCCCRRLDGWACLLIRLKNDLSNQLDSFLWSFCTADCRDTLRSTYDMYVHTQKTIMWFTNSRERLMFGCEVLV